MNHKKQKQPTIAPSMEMDELEVDASPKEMQQGDYTKVTKLVYDYLPDEEK